jgi:TctA family transporter
MLHKPSPTPDSAFLTPKEWWASRRLRYNIGLVVAGLLGFVCYAAAVERCIVLRAPGDWEITIFTTIFQGFVYLVMIGIANLFYNLGAWSERMIRPANPAKYRLRIFSLGFCFSIVLPFLPGVLLLVDCARHVGQENRTIL